jgi:hypothetical protein
MDSTIASCDGSVDGICRSTLPNLWSSLADFSSRRPIGSSSGSRSSVQRCSGAFP